ncbi:MAG: glycosyltransferase [Bacteroidales bacterium]|nr:glycosyltransferase [Bacteroidales bacterium]
MSIDKSRIIVLEVIRQGQIGGGESHLTDLVEGFDERIRPVILSFTPGHMIDHLRRKGFSCYVLDSERAFDLALFRKIRDIIKKEKIQLIHAHGSRAASNMLLISKWMKIPILYTVHGWSFHQDQHNIIQFLRIQTERLLCASSKKVICVSENNRMTGVKEFGLKNAVVINNGINLVRFDPNKTADKIRKELSISKDDFILGFIGRMTIQKDPMSFVKAVELAHQREGRIKALLVGDGDLMQEVTDYIKQHKLNDIIYIQAFRTDVPDLLAAIDVFCLPSLWEGLSIALLEAMAMKKPIIATPCDGTKELIRDGENGKLIDFGRPEDLKQKILDYYYHEEDRVQHGQKARELVEKHFDSKRVSQEVAANYEVC